MVLKITLINISRKYSEEILKKKIQQNGNEILEMKTIIIEI